MAEDDDFASLEADARLNDRLRRRLKGLQSTRVAIEGLGRQLAEAREREAQDQARIRRLERANDALERRVAQLLLDRAQVQGERERVAVIAQVCVLYVCVCIYVVQMSTGGRRPHLTNKYHTPIFITIIIRAWST